MLFAKCSVFFHPQTVKEILNKRALNHRVLIEKQKKTLKCNGILYQNDNKWIIWINGQKIGSDHKSSFHKNLTIKKVYKDHIDLEWYHKKKTHKITIKPNEYYDATLEKITSPYDYS